ncbi:MAG: HEAT repeat domain-containing protein [Pseudobacteriovorax sp.]|nr:HEAT repeat domain-containing protein [Pseudobacteriovorax sp.]
MKKQFKLTIVIISLALIALILGKFFLNVEIEPVSLKLSPKNGQSFAYQVKYSSRGSTEIDLGTSKQVMSSEATYNGVLVFKFHEQKDNLMHFFVGWKPDVLNVSLGGRQTTHGNEAIIGQLSFSENAVIDSYSLPNEVYAKFGPIFSDIFSKFSVGFSQDPVKEWEYEEKSFQNRYLVQYRIKDLDVGAATFKKSYKHPDVVLSEGMTIFDASTGMIRQMTLKNKLKNPGKKSESSIDLDVQLSPDKTWEDYFGSVSLEQIAQLSLVSDNLTGEGYQKNLNLMMQQNELKGLTKDDIFHLIQTADTNDKKAMVKLYLKIKALFIVEPTTVWDYRDYILSLDFSSPMLSELLTALTSSGHRESQSMLKQMIKQAETADEKLANRMIPHLSFVNEPNQETLDFLKDYAKNAPTDNLKGTATLAIGTAAHQLRKTDREKAVSLMKEQAEELNNTPKKDEETIERKLKTIGNIGVDEQLEIVQPYLESQSEAVRIAAIRGLRHIPNSDAKRILIGIMKDDNNRNYRLAAVDSLGHRDAISEEFSAYVEHIEKEREVSVLRAIMKNLGNMRKIFPEAHSVIVEFSKNCGHPDLCPYVNSLVKNY